VKRKFLNFYTYNFINMKYFAIAALLGLISATDVERAQSHMVRYQPRHALHQSYQQSESESESESSESSESNSDTDSGSDSGSDSDDDGAQIQTQTHSMDYPAHMSGFGGYHTYMRDTPDRFETEADDTLMKSMYTNYATEGEKDHLPTGHFWVTKADAERAATEVVGTHLQLKNGELKSYVAAEFPTLW